MCGIVGFTSLNKTIDDGISARMEKAVKQMALRGPDGNGIHQIENTLFGHSRLAIQDPKAGAQPWVDNETKIAVTYNGEIYNFCDLRKTLEDKGHSFRTYCDTEVLVKSYLEWGMECVKYFNGCFAFAICDPCKKTIFAARDRLGVKPFFFSKTDENFIFASVIPAIKILSNKKYDYNFPAISHYLGYGKLALGSSTLFSGIDTLSPGHFIKFNYQTNDFSINRYWQRPIHKECDKEDVDFDEAVAKTKDLVEKSIKSRLISDVPVGAFLSGGLDSAIVAHTVKDDVNISQFPFFCAGSDEEETNEFQYARQMTDKLNIDLNEIRVQPSDFSNSWEFLISQKGLPLSTPNEISIYNLALNLRKKCTVTLTGEGADEIFGGYVQPHFSAYDFDRSARCEEEVDEHSPFSMAMMLTYGRSYFINDTDHYTATCAWMNYSDRAAIFNDKAWNLVEEDANLFEHYEDFFESLEGCSSFDKRMHLHAEFNLENLLSRVDNCTMSASVEARVPFTDHRLVEYAFSLPDKFKMDWIDAKAKKTGSKLPTMEIDRRNLLETKRLIRNAFKNDLPQDIINRKKMSFPLPLTKWFFGPLFKEVQELCMDSEFTREFLDIKKIEQMLVTKNYNIWLLANLCKWSESIK